MANSLSKKLMVLLEPTISTNEALVVLPTKTSSSSTNSRATARLRRIRTCTPPASLISDQAATMACKCLLTKDALVIRWRTWLRSLIWKTTCHRTFGQEPTTGACTTKDSTWRNKSCRNSSNWIQTTKLTSDMDRRKAEKAWESQAPPMLETLQPPRANTSLTVPRYSILGHLIKTWAATQWVA